MRVQGPNSGYAPSGGVIQPWGTWIKAALDAGADGVIVPQVRSAEEVRTIVGAKRHSFHNCTRMGSALLPLLSRSPVYCPRILHVLHRLPPQMTAATRLDRADRHRLISHSTNRQDSPGSRAGALLPILRDGILLICLSTSMRQINPFSSVS